MSWYQHGQESAAWHGERPAVAGLLLYPDKREKMETTNGRDFCLKPTALRRPPVKKKSMLRSNIQLEGEHSFTTTHREDFHVEDFQPSPLRQKTPVWERRGTTGGIPLATHYQRDFLPPLRTHRKSTPAFPQPDNLGINPSLRWEFQTVQKETYPWWRTGWRMSSPQQEQWLSPHTPHSGGKKVLTPISVLSKAQTESAPQTALSENRHG